MIEIGSRLLFSFKAVITAVISSFFLQGLLQQALQGLPEKPSAELLRVQWAGRERLQIRAEAAASGVRGGGGRGGILELDPDEQCAFQLPAPLRFKV